MKIQHLSPTGYLRSSDNPLAIRRLIKLVEENLGLFVSRAVERAKIELSTAEVGRVVYAKDKLRIHEEITRVQFNGYVVEWLALSARLRGATAG